MKKRLLKPIEFILFFFVILIFIINVIFVIFLFLDKYSPKTIDSKTYKIEPTQPIPNVLKNKSLKCNFSSLSSKDKKFSIDFEYLDKIQIKKFSAKTCAITFKYADAFLELKFDASDPKPQYLRQDYVQILNPYKTARKSFRYQLLTHKANQNYFENEDKKFIKITYTELISPTNCLENTKNYPCGLDKISIKDINFSVIAYLPKNKEDNTNKQTLALFDDIIRNLKTN